MSTPVGSAPVTAATTLAVLLGASEWPKLPQLAGGDAFANSAHDLKRYLLDAFALPPDNLLDCFDSDDPASAIDERIEQFLRSRIAALTAAGTPATDVLVHYVGHGGFAPPDDDYFLAVRSTRRGAEAATGLRIAVLAHRLREGARFLRRYVILDCCFAARAYEVFQAAPLEVAVQKTLASLPHRGTALLCSSGPREPSKAPTGARHTMFSGAMLAVLGAGVPAAGASMSLHDLGDAIVEHLRDAYEDDAVRPEVHAPDQRAGDVARVPVFPNPAGPEVAGQRRPNADALRGLDGVAEQRRVREIERKQRVLLRYRTTRAVDGAACAEALALVEQDPTSLSDRERAVLELVEDLIAGYIAPERYGRLRALLNADGPAPGTLGGGSGPTAEPTHAVDQRELGDAHLYGHGVPQDAAEAARWYRAAAAQGDADAQYNLGDLYHRGEGVATDEAEAARWFRRAAEQGHVAAQRDLGAMHAFGIGVPRDGTEAARWFRRAAEQGYAAAQHDLGAMYASGQGVAKDAAEAARWYHEAADQGYAAAQYNLGVVYGKGEGVATDPAEAARWYRAAAVQGQVNAQYNLGIAYANGIGVPQDAAEAAHWFREAADQGDAAAQYNLGAMYADGAGVAKDAAEAARWLRAAADQDDAAAQWGLGCLYANGVGVPQDATEAVRWYRKAAAQGHERAIRELEARR